MHNLIPLTLLILLVGCLASLADEDHRIPGDETITPSEDDGEEAHDQCDVCARLDTVEQLVVDLGAEIVTLGSSTTTLASEVVALTEVVFTLEAAAQEREDRLQTVEATVADLLAVEYSIVLAPAVTTGGGCTVQYSNNGNSGVEYVAYGGADADQLIGQAAQGSDGVAVVIAAEGIGAYAAPVPCTVPASLTDSPVVSGPGGVVYLHPDWSWWALAVVP